MQFMSTWWQDVAIAAKHVRAALCVSLETSSRVFLSVRQHQTHCNLSIKKPRENLRAELLSLMSLSHSSDSCVNIYHAVFTCSEQMGRRDLNTGQQRYFKPQGAALESAFSTDCTRGGLCGGQEIIIQFTNDAPLK